MPPREPSASPATYLDEQPCQASSPEAPRQSDGATVILSALAEEQSGLIDRLTGAQHLRHAGRDFWHGQLFGQPVVLGLTRIGKVAAATTATAVIERFSPRQLVFTGVAGGLGDGVQIGDLVVADGFLQHDLDASPIFPRFEVPLYGQSCFDCDRELTAQLCQAAEGAIASRALFLPQANAYPRARVHRGLVVTGDAFISESRESAALRALLGAAGHVPLAVEMEGAAVAQVCHDYAIPFAAVRTISDRADDAAHVDFPVFVQTVASRYARVIIENLLLSL